MSCRDALPSNLLFRSFSRVSLLLAAGLSLGSQVRAAACLAWRSGGGPAAHALNAEAPWQEPTQEIRASHARQRQAGAVGCGRVRRHSDRKDAPWRDGPPAPADRGPYRHVSGLTATPRMARCHLRNGDLGERRRPEAPTMGLMRPVRKGRDLALAFLIKDPSLTHDQSPAANLRIFHNLHPRSSRCRLVHSQSG